MAVFSQTKLLLKSYTFIYMKQNQKKEYAKLLYILQNLTQVEISEITGVSKTSINKWVNKERWDEQRASLTVTREQQLARLYMQVAEINKVIGEREQKYATPSEADSINKLASAIEKMERETSLADIISVSKRVLDWLRPIDLAKAKEVSGIFDAFIKDNLKNG